MWKLFWVLNSVFQPENVNTVFIKKKKVEIWDLNTKEKEINLIIQSLNTKKKTERKKSEFF